MCVVRRKDRLLRLCAQARHPRRELAQLSQYLSNFPRLCQTKVSYLDLKSQLLCDVLVECVDVPAAAVLLSGLGALLEELEGGVAGDVLVWKEEEKL